MKKEYRWLDRKFGSTFYEAHVGTYARTFLNDIHAWKAWSSAPDERSNVPAWNDVVSIMSEVLDE